MSRGVFCWRLVAAFLQESSKTPPAIPDLRRDLKRLDDALASDDKAIAIIAKAMDYSLRRWMALTRFVDNAQVPIDNNWVKNQIRPLALGRKNCLFAGSLRAGERATAVMSLIQSAKLNGHDPHADLKDVMDKLPTCPNSRVNELLPHRWNLNWRLRVHDDDVDTCLLFNAFDKAQTGWPDGYLSLTAVRH